MDQETIELMPSVNTYTLEDLTGGTVYQITIAANNKYGFAVTSPTLTVRAGQEPDMVFSPIVTVVHQYAQIEWDAPFENYSPIVSYQVFVQNSALTFVDATHDCNNQNWNQGYLSDPVCYMPMSVLIDEYGLQYGDGIYAKVVAFNDRGASDVSPTNQIEV
jgi:hypothetical protein